MFDFIRTDGGLAVWEIILRLALASSFGLVLGLDRELRGKPAGMRTHMLVAASAAATTLVALDLFEVLAARGYREIDPLRVIQGLAQAMGFMVAGVIFVSRGEVYGMTTAANLWMTTAIGMASGAGQYTIAVTALVFGIIIISLLRVVEQGLLRRNRRADHEDE